MPIDVFISYRGTDRVLARRLEQRLRSRWGSCIFRDETSLMAGQSWSDQLEFAMRDAKVMLALVGKGWQVRAKGEDWVRDELLGAIESGHAVLPVIVGDPDELAKKLTTLPAAFRNQAVVVSEDMAGFDIHKIERALRDLGAFENRESTGQQLSEIAPPSAEHRALDALRAGRSVIVTGASGSGRTPLLRRLALGLHPDAEPVGSDRLGLVAACGVERSERDRKTHRVIAAWIDGLCEAIAELSVERRDRYGRLLVNAVVQEGPDLLARQVVRAASLLPLGDDDSDEQILEAVGRPTGRGASFSPERLVSQAVSVLQQFAGSCDIDLTLLVDHIESVDGSSRAVVRRLIELDSDRIHLVLATSAVRPEQPTEDAVALIAGAIGLSGELLEGFEQISLHDVEIWGSRNAVVHDWLTRHRVRLGDGLIELVDNPNPYYALSALWYLVDNGYLVEADDPREATKRSVPDDADDGADDGFVMWTRSPKAGELSPPTREQLLEHKINEHIPLRFRDVVAVGALIGRRFPFSAAYAAACPPEAADGALPTPASIRRWTAAADDAWDDLTMADPDRSVIICHTSVDGERMVELGQLDLVAHCVAKLGRSVTAIHVRLAQYFSEPFGTDVSDSTDDRYTQAKAAAHHWACADEPRHAADAERVAAGLAEHALAFGEARDHYRRSIRLLTQLLAKTSRNPTLQIEDHQDMLILASCQYHLGQMTRLAGERSSADDHDADPTKYFRHALHRLEQLSENLHDKRLSAPESANPVELSTRDLPEPNIIRHHIRLCAALSGQITLELAEWHELRGDIQRSRRLLFDTLRHAEAARGEADSRWLLTAASARLAHQLITDAAGIQVTNPTRAHNLQMEAHYQIERVINLQAVSPDEERTLEGPRTRAWMALGRLFQTALVEPSLAEWAFRRMNHHRRDVDEVVDMTTDRQLGLFLLSQSPCGAAHADHADRCEATSLLGRHARWAHESGLDREHAAADLSMAVLALIEQVGNDVVDFTEAFELIDGAVERSANDVLTEQAQLLRGVLLAVHHGSRSQVAFDHPDVADAFRTALGNTELGDDAILREGWNRSLVQLFRLCPDLRQRLGPTAVPPPERSEVVDDLAHDVDVAKATEIADRYLGRIHESGGRVPSNDRTIWTLLEARIPADRRERARRTRNHALKLVRAHATACDDEIGIEVIERDLTYAIAAQEWYRATDPSRLLTLARESNMSIDGAEWASPRLLIGKMALQVLDEQYEASRELGQERFGRITGLVANWADPVSDADPLAQVFFVAMQAATPAQPGSTWRTTAFEPDGLDAAYQRAVDERDRQILQTGLPVLADLDLDEDEAEDEDTDVGDDESATMLLETASDALSAQPGG